MNSVIASLPETVSPQAMAAGTPTALRVGRLSHASDLFKVFTQEDATKINLLRKLAETITVKDFETDCKDAGKLASEHDTLMGFTPAKDAKGQDKYGPKRQMFNSRSTEMRQVFGVLKLAPQVLQDKGFTNSLIASREYLKANSINWRGESVADETQREIKRGLRAQNDAMEQAKEENPQEAGETIAQYFARLAPIADELLADTKTKAFREDVDKCVKRMIENNSVAFCDAVAIEILRQSSKEQLTQHIATLQALLTVDTE